METYTITIDKWEKHNKKHKPGYPHFKLFNGFFSDPKVAGLTPTEVNLYLYLLCIMSELSTNQCRISVKSVPKQFRISAKSLRNCLARLQSFQLVTVAELPLIKDNLKIIKVDAEKNPSKKPSPEVSLSEPDFVRSDDQAKVKEASAKDEKTKLVLEIWNQNCGPCRKAKDLNKKRRDMATKAINKYQPEELVKFAKSIASDPWCRGENDRGWVAGFDYFVREETLIKASEDGFRMKPKHKSQTSGNGGSL